MANQDCLQIRYDMSPFEAKYEEATNDLGFDFISYEMFLEIWH